MFKRSLLFPGLPVSLFILALCGSSFAQPDPGDRADTFEIPIGDFSAAQNPTPEFASISIQETAAGLVFQPNASEPGNCFGFAETRLTDIEPGTFQEADQIVLVVEFNYTTPDPGEAAPTFRTRLNHVAPSGAFISSTTSEVPGDGLRSLGGVGVTRLSFDRNRLFQGDELIVALDFYNAAGSESNADPNFSLTVEDVDYYITRGDAHSTPEITSAYIRNSNGELVMNVSSGNAAIGFNVRSNIDAYAFDSQYLIGLDFTGPDAPTPRGGLPPGELYGYQASEWLGFFQTEHEIATQADGFNVFYAAVNGPYVCFLTVPGDVYIWDFLTRGDPRQVPTGNLAPVAPAGIVAAGDGQTFLLLGQNQSSDFSVFEIDASQNPLEEPFGPIATTNAKVINGRNVTGYDLRQDQAFP